MKKRMIQNSRRAQFYMLNQNNIAEVQEEQKVENTSK